MLVAAALILSCNQGLASGIDNVTVAGLVLGDSGTNHNLRIWYKQISLMSPPLPWLNSLSLVYFSSFSPFLVH
jgi:hypothetical protein